MQTKDDLLSAIDKVAEMPSVDITEEEFNEILLKVVDFFEEKIENEKIDNFLERMEARIKAGDAGWLYGLFGLLKAKLLDKRLK